MSSVTSKPDAGVSSTARSTHPATTEPPALSKGVLIVLPEKVAAVVPAAQPATLRNEIRPPAGMVTAPVPGVPMSDTKAERDRLALTSRGVPIKRFILDVHLRAVAAALRLAGHCSVDRRFYIRGQLFKV